MTKKLDRYMADTVNGKAFLLLISATGVLLNARRGAEEGWIYMAGLIYYPSWVNDKKEVHLWRKLFNY